MTLPGMSWEHMQHLSNKVRNVIRRGYLLKTYNDGKLLRARVKMGHQIENDKLDVLHPVGYVAHVKPSEKTEVFTIDVGADASRRVIAWVIGDREQHPQPDEGESFHYAPGNKKMFARHKMKKEGGGGSNGSGGGGSDDMDGQTKDSGRVAGFHYDAEKEKMSGTTENVSKLNADKGIGNNTQANFDIKAANATQFQSQTARTKTQTTHYESPNGWFHKGVMHATDHVAGGSAVVTPTSDSAAALFADGGGSEGGEIGLAKGPDGSKAWSSQGIPGKVSLLGTGAQVQAIIDILQAGGGGGGGVTTASPPLKITAKNVELRLADPFTHDNDKLLLKIAGPLFLDGSGNLNSEVLEGPEGPEGPPGPAGPTGPTGPASTVPGPQGPQGPQGIQGAQGVAGSGITMQGSVATSGDLPPSGNTQGDAYIVQADDSLWVWDGTAWVSGGSIQGPPGSQGPIGPQGVQGPAGPEGPKGDTGDTGPEGPQGIPGTGTGNVSNSGTPVANDVAQWVDATHIKGVPLATWRTTATFYGTTSFRNTSAAPANGVDVIPAVPGGVPQINAVGVDTDISLAIKGKGTGVIDFYGQGVRQAQIGNVAGASTYLRLRGAVGQAIIDAVGGGMVNIIDANLSGAPIAPTKAPGDATVAVATTEFVAAAVAGGGVTATAPTVQRFLAAGAFTYTRPAGVKWIRIRGTAGGGGGATSGGGGNGANGGNSTFGTLTLQGGRGGASVGGGVGGVVQGTLPTGASWSFGPFVGSTGQGGATSGPYNIGGTGGGTMCGTGGGGGGQAEGRNAEANTGAGGGGGANGAGDTRPSGGGGGGGASGELIIVNPAASYSGTVGNYGAAGSASGQWAGGNGGTGGWWVEEHYNY
jgi:hypothetical protein